MVRISPSLCLAALTLARAFILLDPKWGITLKVDALWLA